MKLLQFTLLVTLFSFLFVDAAKPDVREQDIDPGVVQLAPFVVYEGLIDVIDGFSEEKYHGGHAVVEKFRETFNQLLLAYHRKLVQDELNFMANRMEVGQALINDLNTLSATFGVKRFEFDLEEDLRRERSITRRLMNDPFFIIEAMVVWDLETLKNYKDNKLYSKFARDIHYNRELQRWERRIITKWEVAYTTNNGWNNHYTSKDQGLNLDTNRGFHLIKQGLNQDVPPYAFRDVKLTYPIFINHKEPVDVQVDRLRKTFVSNLFQIYDPYSWISRRNERFRFRWKFRNELQDKVNAARFQIEDPNWFNSVLADILMDVLTIKHEGVEEIYDLEMYNTIPAHANMLGIGLDLLNWNEGENRSVPYDPSKVRNISVNFDYPYGARFILLDAYRRYGNKVIDLLREKILAQKDRKAPMVSGKQLVKSMLEEVTGMPAEIYIKKAEQAQKAELNRFAYVLR